MNIENKIKVTLTIAERDLILEDTLIEKDYFKAGEIKGENITLHLTPDDLDDILGFIAAESNHTKNKKLQSKLDHIYDHLEKQLDSY